MTSVKYDPAAGAARLQREARRVTSMMQNATPPVQASPHIIPSPARGPMKVVVMRETISTPSGPRDRRATEDGYHPVSVMDAFDEMTRRRSPEAPAMFTVAQVAAGRAYAALYERCKNEGVRCSSPETQTGGNRSGGGQRDWIDGVIARSAALERMQAAIGDGVALSPRGAQAHAERGRRVVRVRDLVDGVCIEGRPLSQIVKAFGWPDNGRTLKDARDELCAALDRMRD